MPQEVISLKCVSKSYPFYSSILGGLKSFLLKFPMKFMDFKKKRFYALDQISFAVEKGETFGVIGNNGAGKSTLLGLMAGVIRPTFGQVLIREKVAALLELGAGFHPELTGIENIFLNGILLGLTKREVKQKLDEIIAFSELEPFIHQPIRTYSSGMMARLGFSVVTACHPQILLIDEILAVGDVAFQKKCYEKMISFKNQGVTIVIVSHAISEVERLCDRALWIENHRMKMIGKSKLVTQAYLNKK